ncbi:MAG: GNAT family N-acetyltransferase [Actinomycetota bacterium]
MHTDIPHTLRPIVPADFPAVSRLKNDINTAAGLLVVSTVEEVTEEFSPPYVDPSTDTVCVESGGDIVGYAHTVFLDSEEKELRCYVFGGVHPSVRGTGIGSAMLTWGIGRARRQLSANPLGLPVAVRAASLDGDAESAGLLAAHGFVPERWFNDLHRTLDDPPAVPATEGFAVVPWDPSRNEELREVKNSAFRDHWGSTPTSTEGWDQLTSGFGARTDLSFMALDGQGRVVGLVLTHRYPDDDVVIGGRYGWIDKVATLAEWRGRGVARAMIATALAAYAREGLTHAAMDVDTDNPTGAFGLYTAMGFVPLRGSVDYRLADPPAVR